MGAGIINPSIIMHIFLFFRTYPQGRKSIMKKIRTILYAVAVVSAIFAGYLSFQTEERYNSEESSFANHGIGAGVAVDTGKDGGAAGFAILSGLALVAASITYLKKEE